MVTKLRLAVAAGLVGALGCLDPALGCVALMGTPPDWVKGADVILRARVVAQIESSSSKRPAWKTKVRFQPVEVLKGAPVGFDLTFEGVLTDRDDRNDLPVPYTMVRPGGRSGNCYAFNYRLGQEYLLILKQVDRELTPYWASLGATNEQVAGPGDKWLLWVRQALKAEPAGRVSNTALHPTAAGAIMRRPRVNADRYAHAEERDDETP